MLALLLMLCTATAQAASDVAQWTQANVQLAQWERVKLNWYGETRLDDKASSVQGIFTGPNLSVGIVPWLSGGLAYRMIWWDAGEANLSQWQRYEVELVPKVKFDSVPLSIAGRARLELLRKDAEFWDTTTPRVRARAKLSWGLDMGPLSAVFVSEELFIRSSDWSTWTLSENRLVPLGLRFKGSERFRFDLWYMLQSNAGDPSWSQTHVAGATLLLDLSDR